MALIKIDAMGALKDVVLEEDANEPAVGEQITILGYPGVSPDVSVVTDSVNPFDQSPKIETAPYPTLTTGSIGKRISSKRFMRRDETSDNFIREIITPIGDVYQLTANATGAGNSGGPVFNSQGKVIGIYFASTERGGVRVTFAIPIKYGREIMIGDERVSN